MFFPRHLLTPLLLHSYDLLPLSLLNGSLPLQLLHLGLGLPALRPHIEGHWPSFQRWHHFAEVPRYQLQPVDGMNLEIHRYPFLACKRIGRNCKNHRREAAGEADTQRPNFISGELKAPDAVLRRSQLEGMLRRLLKATFVRLWILLILLPSVGLLQANRSTAVAAATLLLLLLRVFFFFLLLFALFRILFLLFFGILLLFLLVLLLLVALAAA
mmetsp:Transcript_29589/g.64330  ORF Transcript_29589/g.64330 Transcript_29589/m.64330 type:complete len:214 (-) Transcript_29589:34-675(-)